MKRDPARGAGRVSFFAIERSAVSLWAIPERADRDAAENLPIVGADDIAVPPIAIAVPVLSVDVVSMAMVVVAMSVAVPMTVAVPMAVAMTMTALLRHLHEVARTGMRHLHGTGQRPRGGGGGEEYNRACQSIFLHS